MLNSLSILNTLYIGTRTAFVEMMQHKLRSFLSVTGVMLGVAALVAMLSLIGGIQTFLDEKMGRWAGSMWIHRSREEPEGEQKLAWSRSRGLRLSDGLYLDSNSSAVKEVYHRIERHGTISVGGYNLRHVRVRGLSQAAIDADSNIIIEGMGRMILPEEQAQGSRVCVVSWGIVEHFEENWDLNRRRIDELIGMTVVYNGAPFRIVGTVAPKDTSFKPWHWEWTMVVPLVAMQRYVVGMDPDPDDLSLVVQDPERFDELAERISAVLAMLHRGARDFDYRGPDWADDIKKTLNNISMIAGVISIVSLLIGGLGIMNVMLASISERIKEIGVRKALGASNAQILVQFLAETVTLSLTGGLLGLGFGIAPMLFAEAIKKSTNGVVSPTMLPEHVFFVFLVIVGVGVVFGLYPAVKASRMNPVDALRYE
jgi:putative ABC transport system permease protein